MLGACRTYENLLRGRDSGPKYPDLSLHGYHYALQNHAIFDFIRAIARHNRLLLLATITLSPADFWRLLFNNPA